MNSTDLITLAFLVIIGVVAYRRRHRWREGFRREHRLDWVVAALAIASMVVAEEVVLRLDAPWPLFPAYIVLLAGAIWVYGRHRYGS